MKKADPTDLRVRTKDYALRIIRLFAALPRNDISEILGKQLLRSGTSVGAQYREAYRAKSNADFISKIEGALQELDETDYWLELLIGAGVFSESKLSALQRETSELISIFVTIVKKAKSR